MKKFIVFFLLACFLFCFFPVQADKDIQTTAVSEIQKNKQEAKDFKKKKLSKKQNKDANSEKQNREQRKKDIENKERLIDKNKKVKKISVDENLPETIHQRNIP